MSRHSKTWNYVKKYWGIFFKILLLVIGFISFFDLMPQAYGIYDDILTAYVLMVFWLDLNISRLMFGSKNKILDKFIVGTFYILIINTFVQWFSIIDIADPIIINTYAFIAKYTPVWLANAIKSSFLFVHSPANFELFSFISSYVGFSLLGLIIIYAAFKVKFGEKSLVYCLSRLFIKKETWDKMHFESNKNKFFFFIIKLFLVAVTMLGIYQYLFLLITQWFLITLGKTLLIFAILYAVKDIQGSKIKTLNKIGQFDDVFLGWVTDFLTDIRKFYLGFGILLILHYMSDISTFFVPFFTGLEVNQFFLSLMGKESYRSLLSLINTDLIFGIVETWWVYILSTIGVLVLIITPMIVLFFTILSVNLRRILENKRVQIILNLFIVSIICFLFAPWVKQLVIKQAGIQGVNFVTQLISGNALFSIPALFLYSMGLLALLTLLSLIFRKDSFAKYVFIIGYLLSLFYFGEYIWNYFQSSIVYHTNIIFYSGEMFLSIIFSLLLIMEFLFYIGGFVLLCYKFSRYVLNRIIRELITDNTIILWTFVFLVMPILIMYNLNIVTLTWASIAILILFVFTFAMSKELLGEEFRDDYLLGVGIIIIIYQIELIILHIFVNMYNLSEGIMNFMQPIIFLILAVIAVFFFRVRVGLKDIKPEKIILSIIIGAVLGILFYFVNEPKLILPNNAIMVLVVYTLLVSFSEEILFRGVLLRLAQKAFSYYKAVFLQAFVFAGVHFISLKGLLKHYMQNGSVFISSVPLLMSLYFVLLIIFGIVTGLLVSKETERKSRILYPIIIHWIVNLIVFLM